MTVFSIHEGVVMGAVQVKSPNFNARPIVASNSHSSTNSNIDTIVIHNISLPPNEFGKHDKHGNHYVTALFTNTLDPNEHPYFKAIEGMEVSAHLFITRDGTLIQYVNLNDRAWHAGRSSYLGRSACNDFSIGIELEGTDTTAFSDAQYHTLSAVIVAIHHSYPNTRRHLVGHSDIAPIRKTDPGAHFDWQRLRRTVAAAMTDC